MAGQKRVKDARKRAGARPSIFFARSFYEDRWIAGSSPAMTEHGQTSHDGVVPLRCARNSPEVVDAGA
jgi:hypothetical protein